MWLLRARHASIERSIRSHYAVIRRLFAALGSFLHLQILPKFKAQNTAFSKIKPMPAPVVSLTGGLLAPSPRPAFQGYSTLIRPPRGSF
jgi:hypothetical protein